MATKKKLLEAAAGVAGGAALNVEDVFSTYLWTGTNSANTIANGIDLAGEGGLVWTKWRGIANNHTINDTVRGALKTVYTNSTGAEVTSGNNAVSSFLSNGFTYTDNGSGYDIASWTFRKAPKFFDVVTYTGDGTSSQAISHNLGSTPATIIVKKTNNTEYWATYHRSLGRTKVLKLDATDAAITDTTMWPSLPTDTQFYVGADTQVGKLNDTYVAYLFAHNDGDGDFGPTGDQDVIRCGSYTGNGSADGPEIDLGFEPQWTIIRRASSTGGNWMMHDNMRGVVTGGNDQVMYCNDPSAESGASWIDYNASGFKLTSTHSGTNASGDTYIYIAIRRGPMAVPESATDVFAIDTRGTTGPAFNAGFPIDAALYSIINTTYDKILSSRLTGNQVLDTNNTGAETTFGAMNYDYQEGYHDTTSANSNIYSWMWRRAPNYFDVVAYSGDSTAGRTVSHNLGVAPEMMWVKARNASASHWIVYHKDTGSNAFLRLSSSDAVFNNQSSYWNNTAPTAADFTVGTSTYTNQSGYTFIAYLFASLAGISKVGSFTTTGGAVNVDCGFSSGARFVLLKAASGTDAGLYNWELYDTARGIVAGNDSVLFLNDTSAEYTGGDYIDPYSAGFTFNSGAGGRPSGQTIIYYAIA